MTTSLILLLILFLTSFTVLSIKNFRLGLSLLFGLLPIYLIRFPIVGVPTTALEICALVVIAIGAWQYRSSITSWVRRPTLDRWTIALLVTLLAAIIATIVAPDTQAALGILKAYYLEPIAIFLLARVAFDKNDWRRAFVALCVSGVIASLFAIVQVLTGTGIPAPWNFEGRATGFFDYPNALGLFLAPIVAALTVALFDGRQLVSRRLLIAFSIVVMIVAIILAKTEAAFVAIPAGLLITLLVSSAKRPTKIFVTSLFIGLVAVAFVFSPIAREKLLLQDTSGEARRSTWTETITLITSSPHHLLFGAGLSGYPTALAPYHDPQLYEIFQYPHNIVLNIWVELGLIGLIGLILVGTLVCKAARQQRQDPLTIIAAAALATMLVHGLVDVPFFKNDLALLTAGFLAALSRRA